MQTIDPRSLTPHPKNVKIHTDEQIQGIAEAIKLLGIFKDPIVIDKKNLIWIGNGRNQSAILLDMPLVPIIYLDHLSMKQRKALMIIDNRLNESKWNKENMAEILDDIGEYDFQEYHMDFEEYRSEVDDESEPIPKAPVNPKSKLGDIYQLGKHRIMCGDSLKDLPELINNEKPSMVLTDPPYNIGFKYNNDSDNKETEEYFNIMNKIYHLISDYRIIITPGPNNQGIWFRIKIPSDIGTWIKRNSRSGASAFHFRRCEPIFFYGKFKKRADDVFDYSMEKYTELQEIEEDKGVGETHAPAKPLKFWSELIIKYSQANKIVLDPFIGTGTTLIACEKTDRICFGLEIDPAYVDVIVQRWENLTGKKGILI